MEKHSKKDKHSKMDKKKDKVPKDYYEVLKVGKQCTMDDLKKSYKRLAIKWHPLMNPLNWDKASKHFNRINEAYEVFDTLIVFS